MYGLAFRLNKTRSELLQGVSGSRELAEMLAFHRDNPENQAADHRTASLMAATYNASGNVKKPMKAADFLPKKPVDNTQAVISSFKAAAKVMAQKGK